MFDITVPAFLKTVLWFINLLSIKYQQGLSISHNNPPRLRGSEALCSSFPSAPDLPRLTAPPSPRPGEARLCSGGKLRQVFVLLPKGHQPGKKTSYLSFVTTSETKPGSALAKKGTDATNDRQL